MSKYPYKFFLFVDISLCLQIFVDLLKIMSFFLFASPFHHLMIQILSCFGKI